MSRDLISMALKEDIGEGDVTSAYFIAEGRMARAFLTARREGVVSGVAIAKQVFAEVDPTLDVQVMVEDGSSVGEGAMLTKVEGKARSILTAERTALNFMQRLSGVATLTARYVELINRI